MKPCWFCDLVGGQLSLVPQIVYKVIGCVKNTHLTHQTWKYHRGLIIHAPSHNLQPIITKSFLHHSSSTYFTISHSEIAETSSRRSFRTFHSAFQKFDIINTFNPKNQRDEFLISVTFHRNLRNYAFCTPTVSRRLAHGLWYGWCPKFRSFVFLESARKE